MRLACIAFTQQGMELAKGLLPRLEGWQTELARGFGTGRVTLHKWAAASFASADALLFIGAAGIAVRAIAPHVQSKTTDPAVLVMDEAGRFVVPLLSGHIGGANRLARQLATLCSGQAVLTTATDVNGLWAVDEWAAQQGLAIPNPGQIKAVSARLLRGEEILLFSSVPLHGSLPKGVAITQDSAAAHIVLSPFSNTQSKLALQLVPPCVVTGIGCRRGTAQAAIETALAAAMQKAGVYTESLCAVASIDLKQHEPGLLALCEARCLPFVTYKAEELASVEGSVSSSGFVQGVTGVNNVCERSALAGGGRLLLPKQALAGVTVALALREITYSFEVD